MSILIRCIRALPQYDDEQLSRLEREIRRERDRRQYVANVAESQFVDLGLWIRERQQKARGEGLPPAAGRFLSPDEAQAEEGPAESPPMLRNPQGSAQGSPLLLITGTVILDRNPSSLPAEVATQRGPGAATQSSFPSCHVPPCAGASVGAAPVGAQYEGETR